MDPLIFIEGLQLGMLTTGVVLVRHLRHERSTDVEPRLRRIQVQLDSLEAAINLALMTRYAELSAGSRPAPSSRGSSDSGGMT
jgi:hypothetical protein